MAKKLIHWDEARKLVFEGMEAVAQTVMKTMWPKWKNVLIQPKRGNPISTNDWVTVAKSIEFEDNAKNMWAQLVKEAADKTNKKAGDWTTTTTALTYAIAKEGMRYINTWLNPFSLSRGLHKAADQIIDNLKKISIPVTDNVEQVATISAQDSEVGKLIADTMKQIGEDWVITVEQGQKMWLSVDITQWMHFHTWYASHYFVTDAERMESVFNDPTLIITDNELLNPADLLPLLEKCAKAQKKNLVILAPSFSDAVIMYAIQLNWKAEVPFRTILVNAPFRESLQKDVLEDIATVTWGKLISSYSGISLQSAWEDCLWSAKKIVVSKDQTIIQEGKGTKEKIETKIASTKTQLKDANWRYETDMLKQRLARLSAWIAIIKVGAWTEIEMRNKRFKIEDALNATRAAIEEWIVDWGGITLMRLADQLVSLKDQDENYGVEILKKALLYPLKQIVNNAGYSWDHIVHQCRETEVWFNAKTGEYENLLDNGVIDPAKVIRVSLENAVSAASTFLITDALVIDEEKKD